jgi:hypothetical protein
MTLTNLQTESLCIAWCNMFPVSAYFNLLIDIFNNYLRIRSTTTPTGKLHEAISVSVSSHGTEQSCICVLGVSIFSLSTIFYWMLELFRQCGIFLFLNCSDSVIYFCF